MKKIILLFALGFAFLMTNAQKVTEIYFVNGDKIYKLDGLSLNLPSNLPPQVGFPLAIEITNNGDVLNPGDSLKMLMIMEGETKLTLTITINKELESGGKTMIDLTKLQVPSSELKGSNTWCFDIPTAYRSGVEKNVSDPYCATFTTATSIAEISNIQTVVYPNPAKDVIKIENANNASISFYNTLGQMVRKIDSKSDFLNVNVSDFSNGLYFIKIQNGNNIETKKILINK